MPPVQPQPQAAPSSLGQALSQPNTLVQPRPPANPAAQQTAFENAKEFLGQPNIKAGLLQASINLLTGGGSDSDAESFGRALGGIGQGTSRFNEIEEEQRRRDFDETITGRETVVRERGATTAEERLDFDTAQAPLDRGVKERTNELQKLQIDTQAATAKAQIESQDRRAMTAAESTLLNGLVRAEASRIESTGILGEPGDLSGTAFNLPGVMSMFNFLRQNLTGRGTVALSEADIAALASQPGGADILKRVSELPFVESFTPPAGAPAATTAATTPPGTPAAPAISTAPGGRESRIASKQVRTAANQLRGTVNDTRRQQLLETIVTGLPTQIEQVDQSTLNLLFKTEDGIRALEAAYGADRVFALRETIEGPKRRAEDAEATVRQRQESERERRIRELSAGR